MKYVRPFDPTALTPGEAGKWLLGPEDGAGVLVRLRRGAITTVTTETRQDAERFALVISGEMTLLTEGKSETGIAGELLFIPAGTTAAFVGDERAVWVDIEAPLTGGAPVAAARVVHIDQSRFEGEGFAYQSLIDHTVGAQTMRMNVLRVQPGAGSPDYHIHAFAQIYVIQEGEMTIDIGRKRLTAGANSIVFLPEGVVHRNFNASGKVERHVSLLVPEPKEGQIFDYAVTIHDVEAELLKAVPS